MDLPENPTPANGEVDISTGHLEQMACSPDPVQRRAAALHPGTPAVYLAFLFLEFPDARALNPVLDLWALQGIGLDPLLKPGREEAVALAKRLQARGCTHALARIVPLRLRVSAAADAEAGALLADAPACEVRISFIQHSAASPDALARLARDPDPEVRRWALLHPKVPLPELHRVAVEGPDEERCWLLGRLAFQARRHPTLAQQVIQAVGYGTVVDTFLRGPCPYYRTLTHGFTTAFREDSYLLHRCVESGDATAVRRVLSSYLATPELFDLAFERNMPDLGVEELLLERRHCPVGRAIEKLQAHGPGVLTRASVRCHARHAPFALLVAHCAHAGRRLDLASFMSTPPSVLRMLLEDPDERVRRMASGTLGPKPHAALPET